MYISNELHEKLYNRLAPELNDILLAKNDTIGKAALVDRDIEFDVYVTLAVIRLFKNYIYIKAFRWASDRLDKNGGIIGFITNGI